MLVTWESRSQLNFGALIIFAKSPMGRVSFWKTTVAVEFMPTMDLMKNLLPADYFHLILPPMLEALLRALTLHVKAFSETRELGWVLMRGT